MSIVGTRPPTLDEWNKYELHHRARLAIKPGITGMWQVSGRSEITDFEEVVKLDTEYISEWNVGMDIKLLWKTVVSVIKPTMTGKMVYPIVDKFIVQWDEQKKVYPKAINLGSIF